MLYVLAASDTLLRMAQEGDLMCEVVAYIFPGVWVREAQLVRIDSHNMAVLLMQFAHSLVARTGPDCDVIGNPCKGPTLRAWKFAEWMKIDSVDASDNKPHEKLSHVSE